MSKRPTIDLAALTSEAARPMTEAVQRVARPAPAAATPPPPWPNVRFAVKHPRWEPGAGMPLAGICAGGGR